MRGVDLRGLTVTPVTTTDMQGVELVLLKVPGRLRPKAAQQLDQAWRAAVKGTHLEHARTLILDQGTTVEFARDRRVEVTHGR
jgi:hypothetical protein